MKLSVIIPSYKDPYLQKTIDSLLDNSELGDQLEIIVCLDGYWPSIELKDDDRVRIVHLGKNRGMREAINAGVLVSRGKYIMRTDEHCMFAPGFDRVITERIEDNWIVTAVQYCLDPVNWKVMDEKPVYYQKLKIRPEHFKFEGVKWHTRTRERKKYRLDETMAMQGSVWVMPRSWWDKVVGPLETEGYGPMYQDSHEMVFKTWKAGGKLILNKKTWFAHKHVSFPLTHNYRREDYLPCLKYCLDTWKDYYETEIKPKWKI